MKKYSYYKLPNAYPKGGLQIDDSEGLSAIIGDLLGKIGSNFLKGNFNLMKLKKPMRIYCPSSMLQSITLEFSFTNLINKAADQTDPLERIKLVTCFLVGGIHLFPFTFRSKAPLEPILGETYQAYKEDGSQAFLEQVGPDSTNFLIIGKDKKYKMYGSSTVNVEINGMNGVIGKRIGKNFIEFNDGTILEYSVPQLVIDGLVIGNRVLNFDKSFIIKDLKNGLVSETKFSYKFENPQQTEESFSSKLFGFFSKKEEPPPHDTVIITITDNNNNVICEGNGAWTGQIYFNGKRYWSYDDDYENWEDEKKNYLLPSDCMKRKDLIALRTPMNYQEAEEAHEEILNQQKDDKFFRDQFKKNN